MNKTIKWGIAGLGNIARKFAGDLKGVPQAELVAVASSDIDRAKTFQSEFDGQKAYDNYEDLYRDPEIEVIYIASLNQNHKAMSMAALQAGKGVLCEKPLGLNTKEMQEIGILWTPHRSTAAHLLWHYYAKAIRVPKSPINIGFQ